MSDPVLLPADLPPCLLNYGFSTLPSPLQISSESAASPGMINVWVSTPAGQTVYCNKIVLAVPVGPNPTDFCEQKPSVTPNTSWWAVSTVEVEPGDVLGLDAGITYAIFTAVCPSDAHWKVDYDLAFSMVTAAVNRSQGTFGYVVAENSGTDPAQLQMHRDVFGLTKGPVVTYLNNLVTTLAPPNSTTAPVTSFAAGQPIRVAWESNASAFSVYVAGAGRPVWSGTDTSAVLADGLTADSTITVVASAGNTTVVASVAVAISNPTITPTSVTSGRLTVSGATSLKDATAASVTASSLTASGPAMLTQPVTAGSVQVTGGARLRALLKAGSAAISGSLTAGGASALGAASASSLRVSGKTSWFHPVGISPGGYAASSDGLVVGTVGYPSDAGKKCAAIAYGAAAGSGTAYAVGGNVAFWTSGKKWAMWINPNSFLLPVRRGAGFSVGVTQVNGADVAAPTAFFWVPFGSAAELRDLSDEEMHDYGLSDLVPPEPIARPSPRVGSEVDELMDAVQDVLGDRLSPALAERLRDAVLTLARRPSATAVPTMTQSQE